MENIPGKRFGVDQITSGRYRVWGYFPTGVKSLLATPCDGPKIGGSSYYGKGNYIWLQQFRKQNEAQQAADLLNYYDKTEQIDWDWCEENISPRLSLKGEKEIK